MDCGPLRLSWSGSRRRPIKIVPKSFTQIQDFEDVMGITKRSILFGSSERVHIPLRQKQRVEQKHLGIMDIYEVELCRRGRWEQQDARFVAATDADEAAYMVRSPP